MSRAYDAKHQVLKAYPEDKESGVDLFLSIIDMSEEDFLFENSQVNSVEEYIYGVKQNPSENGS